MNKDTAAVDIVEGGLTAQTEVLTTDGPIAAAGLNVGDEVYALNRLHARTATDGTTARIVWRPSPLPLTSICRPQIQFVCQ